MKSEFIPGLNVSLFKIAKSAAKNMTKLATFSIRIENQRLAAKL